jgi:hypothetical protein
MRTLAIGPVTRSSNAPGSECKGLITFYKRDVKENISPMTGYLS